MKLSKLANIVNQICKERWSKVLTSKLLSSAYSSSWSFHFLWTWAERSRKWRALKIPSGRHTSQHRHKSKKWTHSNFAIGTNMMMMIIKVTKGTKSGVFSPPNFCSHHRLVEQHLCTSNFWFEFGITLMSLYQLGH